MRQEMECADHNRRDQIEVQSLAQQRDPLSNPQEVFLNLAFLTRVALQINTGGTNIVTWLLGKKGKVAEYNKYSYGKAIDCLLSFKTQNLRRLKLGQMSVHLTQFNVEFHNLMPSGLADWATTLTSTSMTVGRLCLVYFLI